MTGLSPFEARFRAAANCATAKPMSRRVAARIAFAVAVLLSMHLLVPDGLAAPPRRGRSSGAAAAAARKKQAVQKIQNQVAVARQVLAAAESQATMSAGELKAVKDRLAAARSEIEAVNAEERQRETHSARWRRRSSASRGRSPHWVRRRQPSMKRNGRSTRSCTASCRCPSTKPN